MRAIRSLVLGVTMLGLCALSSQKAEALEWNVGAYVKGGGGFPSDADNIPSNNDQYQLGFGGGFQLFTLVKVAYNFAVGGDFDLMYHTLTGASGTTQLGLLTTALGLKARLQLPQFDAGLKLNYVHGFGTITDATGIQQLGEPGYNGFLLGIDVLYRFQLQPYRTFLEFGGYLDYMYLGEGDLNPTHFITFGVQAGVTFEFGHFVPGGNVQ